MPHQMIRRRAGWFALALSLSVTPLLAADDAARSAMDAMAQGTSPQAIAEYRRLLQEYQAVRGPFEQEASAYWSAISEKRRTRNAKRREHQQITLDDYVLTQPPVYTGPKRPINPEPEEQEARPQRPRKAIPTVGDLLQAASEQFQWT